VVDRRVGPPDSRLLERRRTPGCRSAKNVTAATLAFRPPQDVAFLADGRVLVADGLMNTRVVVPDARAA
jgi:hypothetical protein